MYAAFAAFLLLHGFAHLVGFVGPWRLSNSVQPESTLLAGRISIEMSGMRALGMFWLGGALAFTVAAVGVLRHAPWWPAFTFGAAIGSLVLCVLSIPQSRIGIPINVAIIVTMLLTHLPVLWEAGIPLKRLRLPVPFLSQPTELLQEMQPFVRRR